MDIKTLEYEIHEWRKKNRKNNPDLIKMSHQCFYDLASQKDIHRHLELFEDGERIVGHKFNGIPLMITDEISKIEII